MERIADGDVQRPLVISCMVHDLLLAELVHGVPSCKLRCKNHKLAVVPLLHPFAKPHLGLLVLIVVGRVNEIATGFVVGVEKLEGLFLAHGAHEIRPSVSNGHCTEL